MSLWVKHIQVIDRTATVTGYIVILYNITCATVSKYLNSSIIIVPVREPMSQCTEKGNECTILNFAHLIKSERCILIGQFNEVQAPPLPPVLTSGTC